MRGEASALAVASSFHPLRAPKNKTSIVLTGFGAFPNVPRNATAEMIFAIARANGIVLRSRSFRAREFVSGRGAIHLASGDVQASLMVLPVSWRAAGAIAVAEACALRASLVLMTGVAAATQPIFIERGSSNAMKAQRDAFGARPWRARAMSRQRESSIDVERAKLAAESALACEKLSAVKGVECTQIRAENAYVCNATTHHVACARFLRARHGFIHFPRDLEPEDAPASARVLLAMVDALMESRVDEAE